MSRRNAARVIGVDPGLNGALACLELLERPELIDVLDMPTAGDDARKRVQVSKIYDWLQLHNPVGVICELAMAMPSIPGRDGVRRGMGSATSFRYGRAVGAIEAAIILAGGAELAWVHPVTWKKYFDLRGADKGDTRALAIKLFPEAGPRLSMAKHQHRADAALMAKWACSVGVFEQIAA